MQQMTKNRSWQSLIYSKVCYNQLKQKTESVDSPNVAFVVRDITVKVTLYGDSIQPVQFLRHYKNISKNKSLIFYLQLESRNL